MATDGTLKHNGSMGAAFVPLGDRVPARSAAVFGTETSSRSELTLLTDSKSSTDLLHSMQQADFPGFPL